MSRKKIGIFTGYFLPHMGGVQRYVDKLSKSLSLLGYEIVIVTSNDDGLNDCEKNKDYTVYRLPIMSLFKKRYPIPLINRRYKKIKSQIEEEKIDYYIVNTRFHLTSLIGARIGRKYSKPVLLIEHGTDHFTVNNRLLDFFGHYYEHFLTSTIKKYVDKYYGVSKNCCLWLKHFGILANGVFYNSIDVSDGNIATDRYEKKYSKDEIIITYAGRLIKEKGILNLLEAFKKVSVTMKEKKVRLVVAGDGPLLNSIKRQYSEKNIEILGKLDFVQVMSLYKRTDIFVYPSLYPEGLPTSILEAGLLKCAIIATPRGGTEEVIVDDKHGIIVDGSPDSLYDAMLLLINDERLRELQSNKVFCHIKESFNWTTTAKQVDIEIRGFHEK